MEKDAIKELNTKIDRLTAILLLRYGLTKEETADAIGVSGRTIQNWLPVDKIKKRGA